MSCCPDNNGKSSAHVVNTRKFILVSAAKKEKCGEQKKHDEFKNPSITGTLTSLRNKITKDPILILHLAVFITLNLKKKNIYKYANMHVTIT